jgi:cell wall-associated NlpC family hydrolase
VAEGEIVAIARTWIGTPYIHQASVKHAGCDCLGLLRGVWRELHGSEPQEIPPYSSDWAEASGEETLANALRLHLREIELAHMVPHPRSGGGGSSRSDETEGASAALMPGDIAVFRMLPHMPAKHCGIIGEQAETLTLIHARQNKRVSEEPFTQPWRRKLAYAFRL